MKQVYNKKREKSVFLKNNLIFLTLLRNYALQNMKESIKKIKKFLPYFLDVWQYLAIILVFIIAAIFIL